jgi:hypothetical protein
MMRSLNAKGYNPLAIMPPSWNELVHMVNLAGPVLLTMLSKVMAFGLNIVLHSVCISSLHHIELVKTVNDLCRHMFAFISSVIAIW